MSGECLPTIPFSARMFRKLRPFSPGNARNHRVNWRHIRQPRFFDRAVRSVDEYYEKPEYIQLDPARAGLVKRTEDWPWSSVRDYTTGSLRTAVSANRILAVDGVLLPPDEGA